MNTQETAKTCNCCGTEALQADWSDGSTSPTCKAAIDRFRALYGEPRFAVVPRS